MTHLSWTVRILKRIQWIQPTVIESQDFPHCPCHFPHQCLEDLVSTVLKASTFRMRGGERCYEERMMARRLCVKMWGRKTTRSKWTSGPPPSTQGVELDARIPSLGLSRWRQRQDQEVFLTLSFESRSRGVVYSRSHYSHSYVKNIVHASFDSSLCARRDTYLGRHRRNNNQSTALLALSLSLLLGIRSRLPMCIISSLVVLEADDFEIREANT